MQTLEQHQSPDGVLQFIVLRDDDGDISLGFDGFAWHTHPEIFSLDGETKDVAVRRFVDDLLAGRSIIAIARVRGQIRDMWVAEDATPDKYKPEDEVIEFRRWNGAKVPHR